MDVVLRIAHIANQLDQLGLYAPADVLTKIMIKISQADTDKDKIVYQVNEIVPFGGTAEERALNFKTHLFENDYNPETRLFDGPISSRCSVCDAAYDGNAKDYPCGDPLPRRTRTEWQGGNVEIIPDGSEFI